jgi:phosphohistidine phosphatase
VRLLIIRHAIAADPETAGVDDAERPLTEEGTKKWRAAAQGLATILDPPDALLTSPFLRARQTAEIVGQAWGGLAPRKTDALAGGSFDELAAVVDGFRDRELVAVVGHEPWLSALLARSLGTRHVERLAFKKGGAALLEVPAGLAAGGQLVWLLPPRLLRALGEHR